MPRDAPVLYLYPLSNYQQGTKGPLLEKDSSVKERMLRMAELYKKFGMRRVVEGLLIAHQHSHPHVLLLQIGNTYFKLPGGRLRVGEHETDGLRRKLTNKLGTPNAECTINWQIGELISTWWRPNFETVMYPYVPPQVASPKECRKIFLTQLPPTGILGVPKNLKLLAVPLFELYDNAHRYGPVIASLPQLLARVKFVFCDHNAQPLNNPHIAAYSLTNIKVKKVKNESGNENKQDIKKNVMAMNVDNGNDVIGMNNNNNPNNAVLNANNNNKNGGGNQLSINPLMNYRPGINPLVGNIYAQRLLMAQQLMAQNMLRGMPANNIRPPNARVILQPSPQNNPMANNPMLVQQLLAAQQQQQQPKPSLLPRPHGLVSPPATNVSIINTNQSQNIQQAPQRPN